MGEKLTLTGDEEELAKGVRHLLAMVLREYASPTNHAVLMNDMAEMAARAHDLHMALRKRGKEPRHYDYMIRNRGMQPIDPHFYEHIHPVEDLLAYLDDVDSNRDPVDKTLGARFDFNVECRLLERPVRYSLTRTVEGWVLTGDTASTYQCGKDGRPGLYRELDHDSINYPEELPGYLEYLWVQASAEGQGLEVEQVRAAIAQLADWVSKVEKGSPDGIFRSFK